MQSKLALFFSDWKTSFFVLSLFGVTGFVNYLRRKKFSLTVMVADIFTSVICGFLTYFVASGQGYSEELTLGLSFLVAHNATRLLFIVDRYIEHKAEDLIERIEK